MTPGDTGRDASACSTSTGTIASRALVAALVRLLPARHHCAAVRTAVSRMAGRGGWSLRLPGGRLRAHAAGGRRLDEAAERIYRHGDPLGRPLARGGGRAGGTGAAGPVRRARLPRLRADRRDDLVSPPSRELEALLETERSGERFSASYDGDARGWSPGPGTWTACPTPTRAGWPSPRLVAPPARAPDEVFRAQPLVHEWRKFLFRDPGLPAELLPRRWAGRQAAEVFDAESARLLTGRVPVRGLLPAARRDYRDRRARPDGRPATYLGRQARDLPGPAGQAPTSAVAAARSSSCAHTICSATSTRSARASRW